MTVNVTSVNDAPAGTDNTVTTLEDTAYTFTAADFGFTDPNDTPANALLAVKITTLPGAGTLTAQRRRRHRRPVRLGWPTSTAGQLVFTPAANANGAGYASFTFQVQDDGGTANGGVDLDPSPQHDDRQRHLGQRRPGRHRQRRSPRSKTRAYTFTAADFGFTDPNDTPGQCPAGGRRSPRCPAPAR